MKCISRLRPKVMPSLLKSSQQSEGRHKAENAGNPQTMPAQGTLQAGKLKNPKCKTAAAAADEFRTAFDALNMDGRVTVKDMAEYMGIIDKTIYARIKKMDGEFALDKGVITRNPTEID